MPIDPRLVKWEEDSSPKIDPRLVKWEDVSAEPAPSLGQEIATGAKNLGAGAIRGAGSIGSTILLPADMINQKLRGEDFFSMKDNNQRRAGIDAGLTSLVGSDPNSGLYKTGKIAAEIAGTSNMGSVIAKPLSGVAPRLANAISSGGFNLGGQGGNAIANGLTRIGGGAINGAASAGAVNPESAGVGAVIGGATPAVVGGAGYAGNLISNGLSGLSNRLMKSALKPSTVADPKDVKTAIDVMLGNGLNVSRGGAEKLQGMITSANNDVNNIVANAQGNVSKQEVLDALQSSTKKFATQATPTKDVQSIKDIADEFSTVWPDQIPVQVAHELKKGTYRVLNGKFGEQGSASVEAQKDLGRGLKEGVEKIIPEIKGKNKAIQDYITTIDFLNRAAGRNTNKDLLGLALLPSNFAQNAMFALDRSAMAKSLAARGLNNLSGMTTNPRVQGLLEQTTPRLFPILGAQ